MTAHLTWIVLAPSTPVSSVTFAADRASSEVVMPNFSIKSLRATNVLRWEYRAGSALFLVWQQGRESETARGDFRLGRDFGAIFTPPATNVFLVKLSYWLNPDARARSFKRQSDASGSMCLRVCGGRSSFD